MGIDEDTALVVMSDTNGKNVEGRVIGTNGVFFADLRRAKTSSKKYFNRS